jgi:hypothetical protein
MKQTIIAAVLVAATAAFAQFPIQDMDRYTLGLGYTFAFRGANITSATVPSHEVIHVVCLAYAPLPYVALQAGVGIDRFSVDMYQQTQFKGGFGVSPVFGISLYSPFFLSDMLRATAGANFLYLDSEDDRGYRYSGFIGNPFLGLILSPSGYVDIAAGARMHLVDGTMESPHGATGQSFANGEMTRGYLAVTLKTPYEKAFMTLDIDMSPEVKADWTGGPREATVGISFGALLGWKARKNSPAGEKPKYFPAYSEMKDKQDKMAEELE